MSMGLDVLFSLPEKPTYYQASFERWNWRGYPQRSETIFGNIYYVPDGGRSVLVDLCGQACEVFQADLGGELLQTVVCENADHMIRLDVFLDIHTDLLTFNEIASHARRGAYRSRLKADADTYENTVYWGKEGSNTVIRIYDRRRKLIDDAKRRGSPPPVLTDAWLRIELECHGHKARELAGRIRDSSSLGDAVRGVLYGLLVLLRKSRHTRDKRLWPENPKWRKLMNGVKKIKLADRPRKLSTELSLVEKKHALRKQRATSFYIAFQDGGIDELVQLIVDGSNRVKAKHLRLLDQSKRREGLTADEVKRSIRQALVAMFAEEKIITFDEARRMLVSRTGGEGQGGGTG